jgi:hypothetical protein
MASSKPSNVVPTSVPSTELKTTPTTAATTALSSTEDTKTSAPAGRAGTFPIFISLRHSVKYDVLPTDTIGMLKTMMKPDLESQFLSVTLLPHNSFVLL